jgi:hypothetical protein
VAVALRTPTQNAEQIKREHACALTQLADANEMIDVASIGDRPSRKISKQNLAEIIEPRYIALASFYFLPLFKNYFETRLSFLPKAHLSFLPFDPRLPNDPCHTITTLLLLNVPGFDFQAEPG